MPGKVDFETMEEIFDAPGYIDESFWTRENTFSKSLSEECASCRQLAQRYEIGNALKGEHQLRKISLLWVRSLPNKYKSPDV